MGLRPDSDSSTADPVRDRGVGIAINEVSTTDNVSKGSDDSINLAWQAGGGLSYEISRYVSVDVGYRYLDMGKQDFNLKLGSTEFGNFELHTTSHEFASAVRVRFYAIPLHGRVR
jgi:opacity protein-like surface antigen